MSENDELEALIKGEEVTGSPAQETASSPPNPPSDSSLLSFCKRLTGHDLLCVFGSTGAGKSKLAYEFAMAEQRGGGQVTFFDVEQGFADGTIKSMTEAGVDYRRVSYLSEIYQRVKTLKCSLVVIDSSTLSITGRWYAEQLDQKGQLLQELQHTYFLLKDWCQQNNAMALIIAQPVSEFAGRTLDVMGDKANFYLKTTLYLEFVKENFVVKRRRLKVFKSRNLSEGSILCDLETTAQGMNFGTLNNDAIRMFDGV